MGSSIGSRQQQQQWVASKHREGSQGVKDREGGSRKGSDGIQSPVPEADQTGGGCIRNGLLYRHILKGHTDPSIKLGLKFKSIPIKPFLSRGLLLVDCAVFRCIHLFKVKTKTKRFYHWSLFLSRSCSSAVPMPSALNAAVYCGVMCSAPFQDGGQILNL